MQQTEMGLTAFTPKPLLRSNGVYFPYCCRLLVVRNEEVLVNLERTLRKVQQMTVKLRWRVRIRIALPVLKCQYSHDQGLQQLNNQIFSRFLANWHFLLTS